MGYEFKQNKLGNDPKKCLCSILLMLLQQMQTTDNLRANFFLPSISLYN